MIACCGPTAEKKDNSDFKDIAHHTEDDEEGMMGSPAPGSGEWDESSSDSTASVGSSGMESSDPEDVDDFSPDEKERPAPIEHAGFIFTADSFMTVGQEYTAELILSNSDPRLEATLQKIVDSESPTLIFKDSIQNPKKFADAVLSDKSPDTTFTIKEDFGISFRELGKDKVLSWKWTIVPVRENPKATLIVSVYLSDKIVAKNEEGEEVQSVRREIKVVAEKRNPFMAFISMAGKFINDKWEWFAGAILIPIFQFLYQLLRKKFQKPDEGS